MYLYFVERESCVVADVDRRVIVKILKLIISPERCPDPSMTMLVMAQADMVPPVGRPTRFRALLIVGGLLALSQAVFTATSTPKWLGAPNSREDSKPGDAWILGYFADI